MPEWPQELIDEYTNKLWNSINEEIDLEVLGEINGIPVDEAKIDEIRKKYNDEVRLAEAEQYMIWQIP